MNIEDLKNKKILILGFGREGQDTLLFLQKKFPKKVFGVADQKPVSCVFEGRQKHIMKMYTGKNYLNAIKNYDIIIKSPGIPPRIMAPFLTKEQTLTSQTDIFFENCPGTVIGVTGTKGKSTTASLCYAVLKYAGKKVHLIGNIGTPVLRFLEKSAPDDIFVYELSSFQLENLRHSPHIAVLLNLYPEHLDHHETFQKYMDAKSHITAYQTETDFLIFNKDDPLVAKIASRSKAQKIPFTEKNLVPYLGTKFLSKDFVASVEPAILVGKLFEISEEKIQKAIKTFKPLPHRLEKVGKYKGITFYNDSLATIPQATIHALKLLGNKVHTLITGGFDRGIDYSPLGKELEKSSVKTLILFPTTGEKILKSISKPPHYFFAKNMEEAVALCYANTPPGSICLLSPASSSFNMFKDYQDRGDQFVKFVTLYGKKK